MEFNQFERDVHVCVGRREGKLFIYECPICDYKVIFDEQIGQVGTMTKVGGDPYSRHIGSYTSPLASGINEN